MKFILHLKDPDGVHDSVQEAVLDQIETEFGDKLSKEEKQILFEKRVEKLHEKISTWVDFGEYLSVEIDTDNSVATVIRRK